MALDALYLQMHGLRWQRLDDHLPMRARRRGDDVEADAGAAGAEAGAAGAPAAAEDEPVPFLARWRAATWAGRGELLLTSLFAFAERLALLLLLIAALIPAFVALAYASFLLLLLVSAAVSFTSEHAMWVFIALWLTYGLHAVNGRMRTQLVVNDERHPLHLSVLVLMLCAMVRAARARRAARRAWRWPRRLSACVARWSGARGVCRRSRAPCATTTPVPCGSKPGGRTTGSPRPGGLPSPWAALTLTLTLT